MNYRVSLFQSTSSALLPTWSSLALYCISYIGLGRASRSKHALHEIFPFSPLIGYQIRHHDQQACGSFHKVTTSFELNGDLKDSLHSQYRFSDESLCYWFPGLGSSLSGSVTTFTYRVVDFGMGSNPHLRRVLFQYWAM